MIWHLLAVFISGLVLGGFAYFFRKLSRDRLPKWIIPVAAGLGMLTYQAFYNYTWYDFKVGQLHEQALMQEQAPERYVILESKRSSDFFRPWSYVYPAVNYFTFVDGDYRYFEQEGEQLVQYIRYEFFHDYVDRLQNQPYLLNCTKAEQVKLDSEGEMVAPFKLEKLDRSSILYQELCK